MNNKYTLLYYWHSKNKFNPSLFLTIKKTYRRYSKRLERIVAFNLHDRDHPLNQDMLEIPIEWLNQDNGMSIHYQIKKYPCLMVFAHSNTLILKKEGIKDDVFKDIHESIKLFEIRNLYKIQVPSSI